MKKDQSSLLVPNYIYGGNASNLGCFVDNGSLFQNVDSTFPINFPKPITAPPKISTRQQVLDRILVKICEQNLLGKSYVEQYLRYKFLPFGYLLLQCLWFAKTLAKTGFPNGFLFFKFNLMQDRGINLNWQEELN